MLAKGRHLLQNLLKSLEALYNVYETKENTKLLYQAKGNNEPKHIKNKTATASRFYINWIWCTVRCKSAEREWNVFSQNIPNYENIHIHKSIQSTNVKECTSCHLRKKESIKWQVGAIDCLFYMYALICFHLYQIWPENQWSEFIRVIHTADLGFEPSNIIFWS